MKPLVIVKQRAVAGLANLLADKGVFNRVLNAVKTVDDPNTPGNEKREAVLEQFKVIGLELASWLANLLVELAVTYIRLEAQKLSK